MANPLLQQYIKVTEFLGLTLGPDYEVALHDMTDKNRSIIAIAELCVVEIDAQHADELAVLLDEHGRGAEDLSLCGHTAVVQTVVLYLIALIH